MSVGPSRRERILAWSVVYALSVGLMTSAETSVLPTALEPLVGVSAVSWLFSLALVHEHLKEDVSELLPAGSGREVDGVRIGFVLFLSAYLYTALYLLKRREHVAEGRVLELTVPVDPGSSDPLVDDTRRFVRVGMDGLRRYSYRCRGWWENR